MTVEKIKSERIINEGIEAENLDQGRDLIHHHPNLGPGLDLNQDLFLDRGRGHNQDRTCDLVKGEGLEAVHKSKFYLGNSIDTLKDSISSVLCNLNCIKTPLYRKSYSIKCV